MSRRKNNSRQGKPTNQAVAKRTQGEPQAKPIKIEKLQEQVAKQQQIIGFARSGPLPIPAELEAYKNIDPRLLPHILATADATSGHVQRLETEWQTHTVVMQQAQVSNTNKNDRMERILAAAGALVTWLLIPLFAYFAYRFFVIKQYGYSVAILGLLGAPKAIQVLSRFGTKR